MRPLLVIVGPTGIGKSDLSLEIASRLNGQIVSADSRLFYRGMDIGTDKPSKSNRKLIKHHLIDICEPDQTLSLAEYKKLALAAINEVWRNGSLPLLVGGTGQYVMALIEGWKIPEVPPDENLRGALEELSAEELGRWLKTIDPSSARRIDNRNKRRVIRALEVSLKTGRPFSILQEKVKPDFDYLMLGLTLNREAIYERIDNRVDSMMAEGLIDEVVGLRAKGYDRDLPSMSGLGYKQLLAYLDGESSLDEAIERIKFETHRLVRQQSTWFRPDDSRIHWYDTADPGYPEALISFVENWLMELSIEDHYNQEIG